MRKPLAGVLLDICPVALKAGAGAVAAAAGRRALRNACADMLAPATRAGAEQALQVPSRVNDVLCYRDGRRVAVFV